MENTKDLKVLFISTKQTQYNIDEVLSFVDKALGTVSSFAVFDVGYSHIGNNFYDSKLKVFDTIIFLSPPHAIENMSKIQKPIYNLVFETKKTNRKIIDIWYLNKEMPFEKQVPIKLELINKKEQL